MKVLILKGLPASGKSTFAKELVAKGGWKRINKDDIRAMIDCGKWSKKNEEFVLDVRNNLIIKSLEEGYNVVVDDTNLAPKHELRIRELVGNEGIKAEIEVKFFDVSAEECVKRDLLRPNSVGSSVINMMYDQFLKPKAEVYTPPSGKPRAYIFDVDGTLSLMQDRSAYDMTKVDTDTVNFPVWKILKQLHERGNHIIIFTARDGSGEELTKKWLERHEINYHYFAIRTAGDKRKDAVVKREMFDKIKGDYNIEGVFDDRNQVVEMWRSLGLTCFQVANGNF